MDKKTTLPSGTPKGKKKKIFRGTAEPDTKK